MIDAAKTPGTTGGDLTRIVPVVLLFTLAAMLPGAEPAGDPPPAGDPAAAARKAAAAAMWKPLLAAAAERIEQLAPTAAAAAIAADPDLFLLDVQIKAEYDQAHLAGATLIPRGLIEFKIADNDFWPQGNRGRQPRRDQSILVYCSKGQRSLLVAAVLRDLGYVHVHSIAGGLEAWRKAGLPLKASPGCGDGPSGCGTGEVLATMEFVPTAPARDQLATLFVQAIRAGDLPALGHCCALPFNFAGRQTIDDRTALAGAFRLLLRQTGGRAFAIIPDSQRWFAVDELPEADAAFARAHGAQGGYGVRLDRGDKALLILVIADPFGGERIAGFRDFVWPNKAAARDDG